VANGSPFFSSKKNISVEEENIRSYVLGGNQREGLFEGE